MVPTTQNPPHGAGHFLPGEKNVPREKRIFTNRNLRMESVRAIGFDMDHTLALYDRDTFEPLTFRMALENLIADRGYPEDVRTIDYDPDFTIRGLIVDKRFGNLLKMDFHNYIARAYHGLSEIPRETRQRHYRAPKVNLHSPRYASFDTFFSMPEGSMFAALVEMKRKGGRNGPLHHIPVSRMYDDVRESVDQIHRDGSLKRVIMSDIARYFFVDEQLPATLQRFRARGKKLFLVTNSEYEYTEAVMSYLLDKGGKSWRTLFDLIIVESRKPGFFMEKRPAVAVEDDSRGVLYRGGNAGFLEEKLDASGEEVLYFGDHTYGDILRSKKTVGWRTAMVVFELEREVLANKGQTYVLREIDDLTQRRMALDRDRDQIDLLLSVMREMQTRGVRRNGLPPWVTEDTKRELEDFAQCQAEEQTRRIDQLGAMAEGLRFLQEQTVARGEMLEREVSIAHNPYWGPTFREGNKMSRFGRQVREFACVYTSRVSNFLHYPVNYYFIAPPERLPHEL